MNLCVEELYFSYKKNNVLNGVSFKANTGNFVCVLGQNGSGKSTLFKCILGLLKGYTGKILIDSEDIRKMSQTQLAKNIAYIPQSHYPSFNYTVMDTVLMGFTSSISLVQSPNREHKRLAEIALNQLGIYHLKDRGYSYISGGERQMVLISRALVQNSKILIMDEPTANLDYGNQIRVMKQIKNLANEGYLILMSTHNPEHALLYSDKVLVLNDGKTDIIGDPKSVLTEEQIEKIYGVPVNLYNVGSSDKKTVVCVAKI